MSAQPRISNNTYPFELSAGHRSRVILFFLIGSLCIAGCSKPRERAGGQVVLRLAHNQTVGHPYDQAAQRFAAGVEEATDGSVRVKVYPSSQLGDSSEQLEGLLLGTLDFSVAAFPFASEFVPEFGLFGAPYLFRDPEHFNAVFEGRAGAMLDSLARDRYRISLIGTLTSGERSLFNSRRPVESLADLSGLKIRVMSGRADALTWEAFGAIPTPMPYSEVYSALQAGVIDGAENEPASILSNRFYEPSPYMSVTDHLVLPMGIFASLRTPERVTEAEWTVIRETARETAVWQQRFMEDQNREALQILQDKFGLVVSYPDKDPFIARVADLQDEIAAELAVEDMLLEIRRAGSVR